MISPITELVPSENQMVVFQQYFSRHLPLLVLFRSILKLIQFQIIYQLELGFII